MKQKDVMIGIGVLGLGLMLFWPKDAKAATNGGGGNPKIPPLGGGGGGGTIPVSSGQPGYEKWAPAQAEAVKEALSKMTALPDVPASVSPVIQYFSLAPNPLGLGMADMMARTYLLGNSDAAVFTNRTMTRMAFGGDDAAAWPSPKSDWVLLTTGDGEPW